MLKLKRQGVHKVEMELIDPCRWYMIKFSNEFGVQYDGPEPDVEFGIELTGICNLIFN